MRREPHGRPTPPGTGDDARPDPPRSGEMPTGRTVVTDALRLALFEQVQVTHGVAVVFPLLVQEDVEAMQH